VEIFLPGELRDEALAPAGLGRPDGVEELRPRARGLGDHVQAPGPPVRRHLPPGGRRIIFGSDRLEEHLVGRDPELETQGPVAVVEVEPVVAGAGNHARRRRDGLVAGAADLEVDLVLPLELDLLVVDPPGEVDVAVGRDERGGIQPEIFA
jgi:hypothetical protein